MNILQNNPYRQLGVYSNSPTKERLANHNRMKAFLKVGKSVSFPLDMPQYLSSINRTEASAADAEAKLTLPKDQILYAQFWFMKATPLDEVAFNHLFAGEIKKAEEIWQKRECLSALQNLIVCALIRNKYDFAIEYAEDLYGNTQYLNQFVSTIIGTGGNFDVSSLAFSFLDILCDEISASKLLPFITNSSWKEHIGEKAVKPLVDSIQEAINIAQKTKGKGSNARLNAGEALRRNTRNAILQLKGFLSTEDLQYQMIADKLGLEILQCGIDYFNDSEEPDAAHKAMSLQKYAKSIVVGQMAKDRCKENVDILQRIIDNLPPSEVSEEDRAIHEELRKFCSLPDKIDYAEILLKSTQKLFVSMRQKLGVSNQYYIKLSTLVVSNALHNVIEEVNAAQKDKSEAYLAKVLVSAWRVTLIMDTFDKDEDFKAHYLSNKETLFSIYKQILLSEMVSSEVVAIYEAIDTFNGTTKPIEKQSDSMIPIGIPIRSSYRWAGMDGLFRKRQFDKITTLLDETKGLLEVVKQCSSVSDVDYRKLSTKIVSMALNDVIQIVNNSTSSRVSYNWELISTISDAYLAILKMDSFDMTSDFKKHFDEQKRIISQMCNRSNPFMHSVDNKSSRTTQRSQTSTTRPYSSTSNRTSANRQTTSTSSSSSSNSSDDTPWGCFMVIIIIILIFLISICR
ncbi:hypothetical protein PRLR6025_19490 [Prevotella lacticifex]|uniref:hypothetical protein n=1 Tax=Prevotella lacticifex TaxID=2854755 RepID=UPI001CC77F53|nr:hypothetical protein [Prevotella lacticifex]GJG68480.1 hypothetical protein PRLR6025_19490 [Prevotella lacticifex]